MLPQTELMQVSDVRGIISHLVREEPVSQALVERARDTVLVMLQQGAENGLTPAEIIRAALAPVFERGAAAIAQRVAPGGQRERAIPALVEPSILDRV